MINSILNRQPKRIITFRLIEKTNTNDITIITDPKTIKEKIQQHFSNCTKTRNVKNLINFPEWEKQYQPKPHINPNWYENCTTPISTNEIQNKISQKKPLSAPGPNNIPYIILKHLGPNCITILQNIFNNILDTGIIPQEWKEGTIYPIPKSKEWMGDLNITRPIT